MAKKRDFRAEYQRRIARGLAKGLSRSQARGHPKANERLIEGMSSRTPSDRKLEQAFKLMRSGESLTKAARNAHVSRERLRRFVSNNKLAELKGRRWAITDKRLRKVATLSGGQQKNNLIVSLDQAVKAGSHWNAVGQFVRTNETDLLRPYRDQGVTDERGQFHPFETDPNELHRLAAMDAPAFHEIYEIVQN